MSRTDTSYDRDPLGSLTPWHKPEDDEPQPGATIAASYADFDLTADISEKAQIAWNIEQRDRLAAESQAKAEADARDAIGNVPADWTPAQIKAVVEANERQQREYEFNKQTFDIGQRFSVEEPRYIPNAANSEKLLNWLDQHYGEAANGADLPDLLHEAFNDLVARGEMQIKATRPAPRRKYTAEELDNLPIEELPQLSNDNARITLEPEVPHFVINPNRSRV